MQAQSLHTVQRTSVVASATARPCRRPLRQTLATWSAMAAAEDQAHRWTHEHERTLQQCESAAPLLGLQQRRVHRRARQSALMALQTQAWAGAELCCA